MPLEIDGFAVLGAIARRPETFPAAKVEAAKTAKAFVGKQLKDKQLSADGLKAVAEAIGFEAFDLIVDGLSDAEIKALLARIDKQNFAIKAATPHAQRQQVAGLAKGTLAPAAKSAPAAKAPVPKKPAVERSGNSKAMKAKRKA